MARKLTFLCQFSSKNVIQSCVQNLDFFAVNQRRRICGTLEILICKCRRNLNEVYIKQTSSTPFIHSLISQISTLQT